MPPVPGLRAAAGQQYIMMINRASSQIRALWGHARFFGGYLKPYGYVLLAVFAASTGAAAALSALPWLGGSLLDALIAAEKPLINDLLLFGAAAFFGYIILRYIVAHLRLWLTHTLRHRLRQRLFRNLVAQSLPTVSRLSRNDLAHRLTSDLSGVNTLLIDAPVSILYATLTVIGLTALLIITDWRLATVALGFGVLTATVGHASHRWLTGFRASAQTARRAIRQFEAYAFENISNISSLNAELPVFQKHDQRLATLRRRHSAWEIGITATTHLQRLILSGMLLTLLIWGVNSIHTARLTPGGLLCFMIALWLLRKPFSELTTAGTSLVQAGAHAARVRELMAWQPEPHTSLHAYDVKVYNGDIAFKNVTFGYDRHHPVLRHVTVHIKAGETVALVGPSGAGKSTLAKLLMAFYYPQQGQIFIDGIDIRHITRRSLRENIAAVWQEPFLIDDTIRANLKLARPDATIEELLYACRASQAWDFIQAFRHGLDTRIGSGGTLLTSSQKQRLAIAQAFLRNPVVLILDEAFTALDQQAEREIVHALDILREGRTTLIIAHRYTATRIADSVIYFSGDGHVTHGTHGKLMRRHAAYRAAVQWQGDRRRTRRRT